jgi:long-chain fatty acid transport protein
MGAMFTPVESTKLGIAYRSQITHNLHGSTTFLGINATPNTTTKMIMPQNIMLSLQQAITHNFNLLGEAGWANWASMQKTIVTVDGYSATTVLNWKNTYRIGLAGQLNVTPTLLVQAGVAYDSSPTSIALRTPDQPMDKQVRIGAGVIYSLMQAIKLGFSYEYINFGNAPINNTSTNGVLAGSYSQNFANVFQASINVAC